MDVADPRYSVPRGGAPPPDDTYFNSGRSAKSPGKDVVYREYNMSIGQYLSTECEVRRLLKEAGERDLYKLACGLYQTHQTTYCIYAAMRAKFDWLTKPSVPGGGLKIRCTCGSDSRCNG